MTKKTKFRIIQGGTGVLAGILFTLSLAAGVAAADPDGNTNANGGSIGTGSTGAPIESVGTGSGGAKPDKIGTGSPDYTKPEPKPKQGKDESDADYGMRVAGWEAGERARIANLEGSTSVGDHDDDRCSTIPTSPNYCYK